MVSIQKSKNFLFSIIPFLLIIYFIGIRSFFLVSQFSVQLSDLKISSYFSEVKKASNEFKNFKEKRQNQQKILIRNFLYFYEDFLTPKSCWFAILAFCLVVVLLFKKSLQLSYLTTFYQTRAPPVIC